MVLGGGMVQEEMDSAREVINYIKSLFEYRGYNCNDLYGSQTLKQNVLDYASLMEELFDYVAVFYHGHAGRMNLDGVLHWDFFDDEGPQTSNNLIWDYDIWPKTRRNKHFFVMLWACRQGDTEGYPGGIDYKGRAVGMPFSWLHPISRGDCFIGFEKASMPLTQKSVHNTTVPYRNFVKMFYNYTLYVGFPVIDALNEASWNLFRIRNFYNTELWIGFNAIWKGLQGVLNGGFERGDLYWNVGGLGDHTVTNADRHSGSYSMLLGFRDKPPAVGLDYAYQRISIPTNNFSDVKLSFWFRLTTYDSINYDQFVVYVAPENYDPVRVFRYGGVARGVYRQYQWLGFTIDINQYVKRNQTFYVYFAVNNSIDTNYRTWCYLDDVSVTYTANDTGKMKIYGNQNINLLTPPSNSQPNTPPTPSGPTSGYTGVSYTYSTSTTDPEGDSVRYQFDWGDGSTTTTDWHPSGTQVSASHSWSSPGTYYVRVRAQDSLNAWGGWSYPCIVNIAPTQTCSLTVLAYNQYGYSGYVPLYIDGQYVGTTGYTYTVTAGTHTIYVESPIYDYPWIHAFQYYYYEGNYDYNNPTTLTVTADKTVTAYYYSYYCG
jgi:hypothetical protein